MPHQRFPRPSTIRNVRPWGADLSDLHLEDGLISAITPATSAPVTEGQIDARGGLAIPGLVNTHAHVDKSWWGREWVSYAGAGGTQGRIEHERAHRDELGIPSVETTTAVLDQFARTGSTAVRTHVDVDLGVGLDGIAAVKEAFDAFEGAMTHQIVAFPQDGVLRRPGVGRLLRRAAENGAEYIGGLDPASIDRDPVGQLDLLFDIAADTGCGIDLHLHDPAELGAFQFELIIERTRRTGLQGRVTIAHGFALAQVSQERRSALLEQMAEQDISMTTVAPLRGPQLPLHQMDAAGVRFGFGTDGIRDLWSPYGTGDLLGIAWQYARASGLARDEELERVVRLATSSAAGFVGRQVHDLVPGAPADIVVMDAENVFDALVRTPERNLVVGGGQVLFQR
jgi:cytosine deaminase